jgi:hypothetical protein
MVKLGAENLMEAESSELVIMVRVFAKMGNLFGDSGLIAAVCKWWQYQRRTS